jgi:cation transport regulator ChaB
MKRYEQKSKVKKVRGFLSPEPGDLPKKAINILAEVYASCRENGEDKEKCAKIAWGAVRKAGF